MKDIKNLSKIELLLFSLTIPILIGIITAFVKGYPIPLAVKLIIVVYVVGVLIFSMAKDKRNDKSKKK